ncbi:MAG: LON peptidase substrate-binding domain-containing protein, partial [Burkholderiaceae bacterium]
MNTKPQLTLVTPASSPKNNAWVPLFPLNAVLFPNGILPLKVFETRYIDMIKECMKQETPFGVVLIKSG